MEKKNYWSERVAHLVIGLLSILIMILSTSYGLGTPAKPGAGMYPFVVGLLILPLSISLFITSLKGESKGAILSGRQIGTFVAFLCACAFWILAMPLLGYVLVTLVATFLSARS